MSKTAHHIATVSNVLGEGPVWNHQERVLYWVDIKQASLLSYNPARHQVTTRQLSAAVMAFGFRTTAGLVVAGAGGFGMLDPDSTEPRWVADPEGEKPQTRFNDGAVDPAGRFWAGTMNEADVTSPVNAVYRLDPEFSVHKLISDCTLANGMGWTADHRTMYITDTGRRQIWAYDYEIETGTIENRRVFAELSADEGYPDGMTVDSEGGVWSAIWGGGKIIRFDAKGQRIEEIRIPTSHVTSCAFGGDNLSQLYVTTARLGLTDEALRQEPLAGDLFSIETDVHGLPEPRFPG